MRNLAHGWSWPFCFIGFAFVFAKNVNRDQAITMMLAIAVGVATIDYVELAYYRDELAWLVGFCAASVCGGVWGTPCAWFSIYGLAQVAGGD